MSVSHRRDSTVGVLLALAWVIAFSLSPVPDGPLSGVATTATVSILFCAGAMVLARLMPGIRSWADLGLLRANPEAWWVSGLLIAATSLGYVAVEWISSAVGNGLTWASSSTTGSISALSIPEPAEIPADVVRSIHTAAYEELLFFAIPAALGALVWRRAGGEILSLRVERVLIAAAAVVTVFGLRTASHSYWGFPYVLS